MEPPENLAPLESRSPSLFECDLAEYCRLQAQVQKAQEQVLKFRRTNANVGSQLDTLESGAGWEQIAQDLEKSVTFTPAL